MREVRIEGWCVISIVLIQENCDYSVGLNTNNKNKTKKSELYQHSYSSSI